MSRLVLARILCLAWLALASWPAVAREPIQPLPRAMDYDKAMAELGKRLFFDPRLSLDGRVSCASCHDPSVGGAESRRVSRGVYQRMGKLNSPTVFNAYFNFRQFWDGRAKDLQEQAAGPIHSPLEMAMDCADIEAVIDMDESYPGLFRQVFGDRKWTLADVQRAIAEFEKALITPDARFDRYLRGELELRADELAGYRLFKSLGCIACHNGINVGGNSYQYLGAVNPVDGFAEVGDLFGRTGDPFDHNRFKVPTLRNVELTAPYMHDGSIDELPEVLRTMAFHNLGFELSDDEVVKLIAFLKSLTGRRPAILDPS